MGVELTYREYGEGPPLLILHGLFGSARNWHSVAQRLAENHRVYALDLRNHGGSPWADTMDYFALAEDVRRFIEDRALAPAIVLGHSMGGKTAMVLALRQPEWVHRLIVVDVAPVDYLDTFSDYIRAMQALDLGAFKRRNEVDAALRERVSQDGIRAFLLQNLAQRNGHFDWRVNLTGIAANMASLAGFPAEVKALRYEGPTRFVCGELSDYVQRRHRDEIRRLFPTALFDLIPDAGHWVHADQPQIFVDGVLEFLRLDSESGYA